MLSDQLFSQTVAYTLFFWHLGVQPYFRQQYELQLNKDLVR